jgi:hypothetical protein
MPPKKAKTRKTKKSKRVASAPAVTRKIGDNVAAQKVTQQVAVHIHDSRRQAPRKRGAPSAVPPAMAKGVSGYSINNVPSRPFIIPAAISLPPAGVPTGPNQLVNADYVRPLSGPRIHSNPFFESGPVRQSGSFEDALARLSIPSRGDKTPIDAPPPTPNTPSSTKSHYKRQVAMKDGVIRTQEGVISTQEGVIAGQSATIIDMGDRLVNTEQRLRQRESSQSRQTTAFVSSLAAQRIGLTPRPEST